MRPRQCCRSKKGRPLVGGRDQVQADGPSEKRSRPLEADRAQGSPDRASVGKREAVTAVSMKYSGARVYDIPPERKRRRDGFIGSDLLGDRRKRAAGHARLGFAAASGEIR